MIRQASIFVAAMVTCGAACADEMTYSPYRYYGIYLPPERHVVEVVQPPWSGNFIINGTRFTGYSPACFTWAAGERIKLIEGDWYGQCDQAVFYNFYRRSTCAAWCR
jgi:hypothetical protein